jgi:hypothetical protein
MFIRRLNISKQAGRHLSWNEIMARPSIICWIGNEKNQHLARSTFFLINYYCFGSGEFSFLKCQNSIACLMCIRTNGQSTLFSLIALDGESKGECDDHSTYHWSRHARPAHTQGHLTLICPCAHKIHMCGERERKKKENALFDWKDDNEREEMRETKDTFGRNVIQKFFFYVCGESLSIFGMRAQAKTTEWNKEQTCKWGIFSAFSSLSGGMKTMKEKICEALNILICSGFYDLSLIFTTLLFLSLENTLSAHTAICT